MPNPLIRKYIFSNSPFIPSIDHGVVQKVKAQVSRHEEPVQMTVAQEIRALAMIHSPKMLMQLGDLNRRFGTLPDDMAFWMCGYDSPLCMILLAIISQHKGDQVALDLVCPPNTVTFQESLNQYHRRNVGLYRDLMRKETLGAFIFNHEEDFPFSPNIYYQVGIQAAEYMYIAYMGLLGVGPGA